VTLDGLDLNGFDLRWTRLVGAKLRNVKSWNIQLAGADLSRAKLDQADLSYGHLDGAKFNHARMVQTNLTMVSAQRASFREADLSYANLGGADLRGADLSLAHVSGVNAWRIEIDGSTRQKDMKVDVWVDPLEDLVDDQNWAIEEIAIKTDHLEAAHLMYLVSSRQKMRTIIDALTRKVVLVLGSFGPRRRSVLLALREHLAQMSYAPIVFDFPRPEQRDLIETVALLANMSRFVIADLTRPRSTPLEAMLIAPQVMVPFAPIIREGESPFAMFAALQAKYDWILDTTRYKDSRHLLRVLGTIVTSCERKADQLVRRRRRAEDVSHGMKLTNKKEKEVEIRPVPRSAVASSHSRHSQSATLARWHARKVV
jgi:hypothetical protein